MLARETYYSRYYSPAYYAYTAPVYSKYYRYIPAYYGYTPAQYSAKYFYRAGYYTQNYNVHGYLSSPSYTYIGWYEYQYYYTIATVKMNAIVEEEIDIHPEIGVTLELGWQYSNDPIAPAYATLVYAIPHLASGYYSIGGLKCPVRTYISGTRWCWDAIWIDDGSIESSWDCDVNVTYGGGFGLEVSGFTLSTYRSSYKFTIPSGAYYFSHGGFYTAPYYYYYTTLISPAVYTYTPARYYYSTAVSSPAYYKYTAAYYKTVLHERYYTV